MGLNVILKKRFQREIYVLFSIIFIFKVCKMEIDSDKLHSLYSSPNIVKVIKSRRMRWAGHVARMRGEVFTGFWLGGPKEETTGKTKA
jgi:hypothetical protein